MSRPAGAAARPLLDRLDTWRFLIFGRAFPGGFFAFVGYLQWQTITADFRLGAPAVQTVVDSLYLAFVCLPVGIYIVRPRPRARDGRIVARIAAFVGTLILVSVPVLPGDELYSPSPGLLAVLSAGLLWAWALAVWGLLYLRKSFSIIPEARRLVAGGPYRVIRHPLYAAEILAGLCAVLRKPAPLVILAFAIFVAAQLFRSVFEERLLVGTFPEYDEYRRHTWRLIPLVF